MTENQWTPERAVPERLQHLLQEKTPVNSMLAFVQIVRLLKTQPRTGWIDKKIPQINAESISDHMYRMLIIAMALPRLKVDVDKCVKIALVHDIAEALVGDITPAENMPKQEKHRRELAAIEYMANLVSTYNSEFATEMTELWWDYEEIRCLEARYVKDIDKYEMIQQAWDYEQDFGLSRDLSEFYLARSGIVTEEIGDLCDEVIRQRTAFVKTLKEKS
ncbi:hypothetical protein METBIDRAFT_29829 [Metschnikowia bicuspidata var. bicuspidata NRRL YB-4993]|uniref:5'-deoxynucleotidase n=1 Tax=Metschnikowia bicuspidata var. bicuspidata NRRL YB-4993 TaxID=869754 RepID=A0A1A0HGN2_9ASCO|nr:hypothetical protein METBIDRAFT_29829 [Metschnikowia bicuspidata var. bicuspidata NRRL YB-4993]OBA23329.1 hypothetical protein METBIDRAFT_29829 [Metschnikowia bicuspidata var. bicuspidata NRRL YB-4993]